MPSAASQERKVANAATVNNSGSNSNPAPSNNQQISKSGSIDTPMTPLQQVLVMVDKKVRNLDKRKTKLEQLKEQSKEAPKELTTEQRKAIAKCEEVVEILEFFKDFRKSVNNLFLDSQKVVKAKEAKERAERAKEEREKVKNVLLIQELLIAIGTPEVRKSLATGSAGIEPVSEERLRQLDELYEITNPKRNEPGYVKSLEVAASRLNDLVDGRKKEALKGVTFLELRDLIFSIDKALLLSSPSSAPSNVSSSNDVQPRPQGESQQQQKESNPPSPLPSNNDQQQEPVAQQPPPNYQVSFGSLDSTGSSDPAIVQIGFPPGVPSSAGIILAGPYGPLPLPPGQIPPQFMTSDGQPVYGQPQQQSQEQVPQQQQTTSDFGVSGLGLNEKQVQGHREDRFKGSQRKGWNRGPRDGGPRDNFRPRNHDGRVQGAPNANQRHETRGPREHNNNFPNGGGFKGAGRPRNNNHFNGPRTSGPPGNNVQQKA